MAGTLTFTQFQDRVRYRLDQRTDTDDLPEEQVQQWINWAYEHVSMPNVYYHHELQSTQNITLTTDADYGLNDDVWGIYDVSDTTFGYFLEPRDIRYFDERPITDGQPREFARWQRRIHVRGRPIVGSGVGDNVQIRYWLRPDPLADPSDQTVLHPVWDESIVVGAVWRAWRDLNQPDRAEIAREEFGLLVNEVVQVQKIEGQNWKHTTQVEIQSYLRR